MKYLASICFKVMFTLDFDRLQSKTRTSSACYLRALFHSDEFKHERAQVRWLRPERRNIHSFQHYDVRCFRCGRWCLRYHQQKVNSETCWQACGFREEIISTPSTECLSGAHFTLWTCRLLSEFFTWHFWCLSESPSSSRGGHQHRLYLLLRRWEDRVRLKKILKLVRPL